MHNRLRMRCLQNLLSSSTSKVRGAADATGDLLTGSLGTWTGLFFGKRNMLVPVADGLLESGAEILGADGKTRAPINCTFCPWPSKMWSTIFCSRQQCRLIVGGQRGHVLGPLTSHPKRRPPSDPDYLKVFAFERQ
jgi:hypothetical protein